MDDNTEFTSHLLPAIIIIGIVSLPFWLFAGGNALTQQSDGRLPITVNQLQQEVRNGVLPIEIRCEDGRLITPNKLEGFICTVRNNTSKNINALNLWYSISFDRDAGRPTEKDTYTLTVETLIHPDFQNIYDPISPGTEQRVKAATISYDAARISGVEVGIDYVEFDDGTIAGPNMSGSKIISDMRRGAAKYESWLVKAWAKSGNSASAIAPLLKGEQVLPDFSAGLDLTNSDEQHGALAFRNRLRRLQDSKGVAEVEKVLRPTKP